MKKRIEEIDMIKGLGILYVMISHMLTIACIPAPKTMVSLGCPVMIMFFFLSGYTSSAKGDIMPRIKSRFARILLPYYKYSAVMIAVLAIIYLLIEKRSLAWFADGTLGILFQLQSFHLFDPSATGVHSMFYSVLIGWFIFQMAVSELVFIPLMYALEGKKRIYKFFASLALLLAGALFYVLNLQGLNGRFFPTVCKIFILPNIPGIAGLMMLGKLAGSLSLLDLDLYTTRKKLLLILGIPVTAAFVLTDDFIYDFPIGKWGAFGWVSYLLTPVYAIAVLAVLALLCFLLKKASAVKSVLTHYGTNSMDYLLMHLFIAFLVAYAGGFWYEYLNGQSTDDGMGIKLIRCVIMFVIVLIVSYAVIKIKERNRAVRKLP